MGAVLSSCADGGAPGRACSFPLLLMHSDLRTAAALTPSVLARPSPCRAGALGADAFSSAARAGAVDGPARAAARCRHGGRCGGSACPAAACPGPAGAHRHCGCGGRCTQRPHTQPAAAGAAAAAAAACHGGCNDEPAAAAGAPTAGTGGRAPPGGGLLGSLAASSRPGAAAFDGSGCRGGPGGGCRAGSQRRVCC